jgi:acetylornithine/succinyldiaminopimelate/putrescine aminotransferase
MQISQRALFLAHLAQTSPAPMALEVSHAEGVWIYGTQGEKWLDLIAGIGVSSLGHRHPAVEAAVLKQVGKYWHQMVYGEYVLTPQVQLAQLIAQHTGGLDSVYLTNSGTEATEGAMKLAKRYTGRYKFVACQLAYHGSTQGAASLMSPTDFTEAFMPLLPGINHIRFGNFDDLEQINTSHAAIIIETVQAEAGIYTATSQWWQALRHRCTETGVLLILDEIQAGCGRTGVLFAYQAYGIVPDVLLLAKGFGGGMPIGAFVARKEVMDCLSHQPVLGHITTYGGHPVCAAAAFATLKTMLETDLLAQIPAKEALFRLLLVHPRIKAIRSAGLWLAVELSNFEEVQTVIQHCVKAGVITDWFLFNDRSLRIAPPLTITEQEITWACEVLIQALNHAN